MSDKNDISRSNGLLVDRRQIMQAAAALGLGFGASMLPYNMAMAQQTPKKGGTLRLGLEGGSASDSLDPRTYADTIPTVCAYQIFNALVEIDDKGDAVGELLESWEFKPGVKEWVFNVRKGITFHSGKTLDADDIIYSLNLHRGDTISPAKTLLETISEITKINSHQIRITLSEGNLDLPYLLADWHVFGVPNGFKDFSKPDGTGAYKLVSFKPGVEVVTRNTGNYWKPGRGNFDEVILNYIPDPASRLQALTAGQVDVINRVDPKTVDILSASQDTYMVQTKGSGYRYAFVAMCDQEPYTSKDVRQALKYGIDRQQIVDIVHQGYATPGNDTTVSPYHKYYAKDVPQTVYDPDKAAFHYKKAGSPKLELKVSEGAFSGATDAGLLYQEAMKKAGINMEVTRVSGDGYWSNVWLKEPFCAVYWAVRPTIDSQLSQTFLSKGAWNDSHWSNAEFDKLVIAARVEADEAKRKEMYAQAQKLVHDDGGMICYAVGDYLDGYAKKVKGTAPHARFDMCDNRVAEKCWFE